MERMDVSRLAHEGRLDMLMWAREKGCPWDSYTTAFAARGGHLPTLMWAYENGGLHVGKGGI